MRRSVLFLLGFTCLALAGCQRDEEIASYEVKHPDRVKSRKLAAIVPHGDASWYFLLSGPEEAVARHKDEFNTFVESLRVVDDAPADKAPFKWTLPAGWKEQAVKPSKMSMRVATLTIPDEPKPLEVAVTKQAKLVDNPAAPSSLRGNLNRWRGQLTLPPVEPDDVEKTIRRIKVSGQEIILADLSGVSTPSARALPMAQAPAHEVMDLKLPVGGEKADVPFIYQVPKGWEKGKLGQFAQDAYVVGDGGKEANIKLTRAGGDLAGNFKRWRDELKLPPVPPAELLRSAEVIKVAGIEARYVDLSNPRLPGNNRTLGVIVPMQGTSWFIKMHGPDELVGREKANFETFVKSFKLDAQ